MNRIGLKRLRFMNWQSTAKTHLELSSCRKYPNLQLQPNWHWFINLSEQLCISSIYGSQQVACTQGTQARSSFSPQASERKMKTRWLKLSLVGWRIYVRSAGREAGEQVRQLVHANNNSIINNNMTGTRQQTAAACSERNDNINAGNVDCCHGWLNAL